MSILSLEVKALLQLFCLQPIIFGWRQNSFSGAFAAWGKIKFHYFSWADQDWIGPMIFKNFADLGWIGFNFFGSGLDSDWKISQSAHLCWVGENLTTINMVEWVVTRQSSVRVTPLLYLVFRLMYLHKIVRQNYWTLVMYIRKAEKCL